MYHALTIGIADDLLADLQTFFVNHKLHIIPVATIQAAGQLLSEKTFHLLIVDLEYLRNIKQTHWISSIRHTSFAPVIVLSDTPEQDNAIYVREDKSIEVEFNYTDQYRRIAEYIENNKAELCKDGGKAV